MGWLCRIGFVLISLTALLAGGRARAESTVDLRSEQPIVHLAPWTHYFHDAGAAADLDAARAAFNAGRFQPLPSQNPSFGFKEGAFWFHVRLANHAVTEPRWLLVQQYALSDKLDVFAAYADGRVAHHIGGDALPFNARSIRYRHPNFMLRLPVGEPVDVFVRVESQSSMQVPLVLYTPTAFTEMSRDAQFAMGLYYGILTALFFYNLVLWQMLRDSSYGWYLLHITAFGLVLLALNGLGYEYLWPTSPWLQDRSVPLSICLAQIGMQQFARSFLGLKARWPLGDRVGLAMILFFVAWGIASIFLPYRVSTPLASLAVFASIVWIAVEAVVVTRSGYLPARLFLAAWGMFLLGTGMFAAVAFAQLPKMFVTDYGVQIGSAMEMLLLSVALGYRYSALRNENERVVREAKEQLEHKVEQRTSELSNALAQLGDAHARLRESSQRDGLTGLHTRMHFHERFTPLVDQARQHGHAVTLLMIDLDHFKQINDEHGHLVGDECLRWAAHAIGQVLRPHNALLARFGGEEFVAALPGQGLEEGLATAEAIRIALAATPCRTGGRSLPLSASIGMHVVDVRMRCTIESALQQADDALYRAKADGRNCIRTSSARAA
ncbi:diguanylate cyclase (GGDEF)-like protein [Lysobacter ruishenii]|uniref:diguanylate cyclase n=1 Tax=Aerolutibacter ruishenii TaxID=686800 RepID=A0A562LWL3_9GAMM|nr:diguanylate cyclase (GGDEF)-like protein [Lysobacter ruishenii]